MRQDSYGKLCYALGLITAALLYLVFSLSIKRPGPPPSVHSAARSAPAPNTKAMIYLPADILAELIRLRGSIDNAGNPTEAEPHDTIMTEPAAVLGWVLRPSVRINGYMLRSQTSLNFWTPVLYLNAVSQLSDKLTRYLQEQARLKFSMSTDENGFRKTLPLVEAQKKILIVGDSVAFGLGVNDEDTVASRLQRLVGNSYRIVNAAVGGYDGAQAGKMAQKLSAADDFSCLIYVAYQNDFEPAGGVTGVLGRIAAVSERFKKNVIVCFQSSLMHCEPDMFLDFVARNKVNHLQQEVRTMSGSLGFSYCDWTDITDAFQAGQKSLFVRFSLYNDHCHLSPQGNELLAQALFKRLQELKLL
ncbi:MAG TPA: SGNH/GDSL hydrolase family protein [Patescibacteria group bacterium]|nr:SGNH/GDSL hydrolase family protein [Patescibacteria group bacterium]